MSKYNDEYYILFMSPGDEQIYINPDMRTSQRGYRYTKLIDGGAPLFFENSYRDEDNNQWPISDILVDSSGAIINQPIFDLIKHYDIKSLQFYPAIYIDDDEYHENYTYFGFYEDLNCLDVENSMIRVFDFDEEDIDEDDEVRHEVDKYSLQESILDKIDEENRLMFKIGECSESYIFVHEKLVRTFTNFSGAQFIKVADFIEGMQHEE